MDKPTLSLIIPIYNESEVIDEKFKNINEMIYPKENLEIVFVDGGSTDNTLEKIFENELKYDLNVMVVKQGKRLGFNKAVVDGFYNSTGEIILIPGAETIYEKDALKQMIKYFSNEKVGAVNGKQVITNLDAGISPKHEKSYRNLQDFIKEGENNMDTLFDVKGEVAAARREIVEKLVYNTIFDKKGCIDCCLFFQAKKDGYKTVYEPNFVYYELSPETIKDSLKQRIRRANTLIQNMMIYKEMIFNRQYGIFGMIIMPAHYAMLKLLPFLFIIEVLLFIILNILLWPKIIYMIIASIGLILLTLSTTLQSFIKLQLVLVISNIKLMFGTETQKFERINSTRNNNSHKISNNILGEIIVEK
jgi:cellulose synthase/poly-beta-1,6-N-acetylglucosamine synthase-like glycosyltransferase